MKKIIVVLAAALAAIVSCSTHKDGWKLVWTEDFDGKEIDTAVWSRVSLGPSDWNNMMSLREDLAFVEDGQLVLLGKVNDRSSGDTTAFVTGGVKSSGRKAFRLAKVEIKAKFNDVNGFWPALWMMPDGGAAPGDYAEIDIMEHLNHEDSVYQTLHSRYTLDVDPDNPPHSAKVPIKPGDWNVYAAEVYQDSICLYTNGVKSFTYPRVEGLEKQFPWPDYPFFFILSNQLEGRWVGKADRLEEFPSELRVDWIKVYERD